MSEETFYGIVKPRRSVSPYNLVSSKTLDNTELTVNDLILFSSFNQACLYSLLYKDAIKLARCRISENIDFKLKKNDFIRYIVYTDCSVHVTIEGDNKTYSWSSCAIIYDRVTRYPVRVSTYKSATPTNTSNAELQAAQLAVKTLTDVDISEVLFVVEGVLEVISYLECKGYPLQVIKGHSGNIGNTTADRVAKMTRRLKEVDEQ